MVDAVRAAVSRVEYARRLNRVLDHIDRHLDGDDRSPFCTEDSPMQVRLIDRVPVGIAYLRYVGPYGPPLGAFWQRRVMPWIAEEGLGRRPMYCISHDNPGVTAPDRCRADAGVEVTDDFVPAGEAATVVIPGGRYATTRFAGSATTIHRTWEGMMREWLPASGLQLDARPMFEYYGPGTTHDAATGRFECEVTIPVAPP